VSFGSIYLRPGCVVYLLCAKPKFLFEYREASAHSVVFLRLVTAITVTGAAPRCASGFWDGGAAGQSAFHARCFPLFAKGRGWARRPGRNPWCFERQTMSERGCGNAGSKPGLDADAEVWSAVCAC